MILEYEGLKPIMSQFNPVHILTAHVPKTSSWYYQGYLIKSVEMGGECSKHGENENSTTFWSINLKRRYHSGNLGVDQKIILKWVWEKQWV